MNLFRTKPVAAVIEAEGGEHTLKRALTAHHLVLLGIGAVIGAGIFVMTGNAAANYAGPAIILSFVMAGVACAFAGLCYAEFAAMLPVSGSAYSYSYATLGEVVAWFIGWMLILEYTFAAATVAVGWSGYFVGLLESIGSCVRHNACAAGSPDQCAAQRRPGPARTDRRADQPACSRDRHRRGCALLSRHHAVRDGQRDHRPDQGRRDPALHGGDAAVRESGQLDAFHPAAGRPGSLRLRRRGPRRERRVLRLHRL